MRQGMNPTNETDRLIRNLAREAVTERDRTAFSGKRILLLAATLSFALALAMVFLLVGVRHDLMATIQGAPFHHKVATTLALACGGFILVRDAARPDATGAAFAA